jgi:hypothetical protein
MGGRGEGGAAGGVENMRARNSPTLTHLTFRKKRRMRNERRDGGDQSSPPLPKGLDLNFWRTRPLTSVDGKEMTLGAYESPGQQCHVTPREKRPLSTFETSPDGDLHSTS